MRKEFEHYYRTDLDEQKTAGSDRLRFFTEEGRRRLDVLIGQIKKGAEDAASAKAEFIELTLPWAEWRVQRYERKMQNLADGAQIRMDHADILPIAIDRMETSPDIKNWQGFTTFFGVRMKNSAIDKIRRSRTSSDVVSSARAAAEINYAVRHRNGMVNDDPSEKLEWEELQKSVKKRIDEMPEPLVDMALLYPRLEEGRNWLEHAAKSIAVPLGTAKSRNARMRRSYQKNIPVPVSEWGAEHPMTHEAWARAKTINKYSADNLPLIAEQKAVLRELLHINDDMSWSEIKAQLRGNGGSANILKECDINTYYVNLLGNNNKNTLIEALRAQPDFDEEKLARFNAAFERLRELTGYKAKKPREAETPLR